MSKQNGNRLKKVRTFDVVLHICFIIMSLCFIIPLLLVISASFTSEKALETGTFGLIPTGFNVDAYKSAFSNGQRVIRAYGVTIAQSFLGTFLSMLVAGLASIPLEEKQITWIIFFTMLYGASMIPTYITYSKTYRITDTFWMYILPGITGGAWNTMIYRTFFKGLPESLFESAHLDGASELRTFFQIVIPLSTPVFASLSFMSLVGKWNDYTTSMVYIRSENLYTLQFLLQRMMQEAEFLKGLAQNPMLSGGVQINTDALPAETLKYAMCVIAAGPMLVVFPFFQKYFAQGLTVGSVKG